MKRKKLDERLWNAQQSWSYEAIYELTSGRDVHKIRIYIKRNAYDAQSHLKVERWDGSEWKQMRYFAMTAEWFTFKVSYVDQRPDWASFRADTEELLDQAVLLLA